MTNKLSLTSETTNKLKLAGLLFAVCGWILAGLLSPAWAGDSTPATTEFRRRAGIHFGPVNAVEEKVDELDEQANDYWTALWEDNGCTGDETAVYNCEISFPQKVLNYWAHHKAEQPDKFGVSVTPATATSSDDSDTVAGTKSTTGSWPVGTGAAVSASPAVADDGSVYAGSNDGKLYARTATGAKLWTFSTSGEIDASPAVNSDGEIFFGNQTGSFYAVGSGGNKLWETTTGAWIVGSAAISQDNSIFVGNTAGEIYSFTSSGDTNWVKNPGGKITGSPAIGKNSSLYLGTWDGNLYAMDSAGGTVNWSFPTADKIKSSPALRSDSMIYLTSLDGYVYALKDLGNTYNLHWKKQLGDSITASPAIGSDSDLYVGDWSGKMYSLQAGGGTINWTFNTTKRITSSPAVGANGNVYFGAADGNLYGLDKEGNGLWKLETGDAVSSSPAVANSKIYCGSNDGKIYGADVTPTGLFASDWPKYRAVNKNYGALEAPTPKIHTGPAWYVNDTSTTNGDIYTSATGSDANSGGPSDPFRTFNKALQTADAGETIYIDGGTFSETAAIQKSDLAVIGAGQQATTFDYGDSTPATGAVALAADTPVNLSFSQLGIENYFQGIKLTGGSSHRLQDVRVSGNDTGILLAGGTGDLQLSQASILNNTFGLSLVDGSNCRITNNRFARNNAHGVKITGGGNNLLAANELQNNENYQLYYANSNQNDRITKNNINVAGDSGIYDATANHDFQKNWWDTTARDAVAAKLTGSDSYLPYRLGEVDTAPGADTIAPPTPTIDTVVAGYSQVEIRWSTIAAADFKAYRIYRATDTTTTDWKNTTVAGTVSDITDTNYLDTGLTNGDTYYYRVSAVDTHVPLENESFFSDTRSARPAHSGPTWYVNDSDTTDDTYTTTTGSDTQTGGPDDPFGTINKGLAVAASGETVLVDAGTYSETAAITKDNLTLSGADSSPQGTVIDPGSNSAIALQAKNQNNLKISNLRVANSGKMLELTGVYHSKISKLHGDTITGIGLRLTDSDSNLVRQNTVLTALNNYVLENSLNNKFENNLSDGSSGYGFYLSGSSGCTFVKNVSVNNSSDGLRLENSSADNRFIKNKIRGNGEVGVLANSSPNNIFSVNTVTDNNKSGLEINGGSNWRINSNLIRNNADTGLALTNTDNFVIYQNEIFKNNYQLAFSSTGSNHYLEANNIGPAGSNFLHSTVTGNTISLTRNWWSTTDKAEINNAITGAGSDSIIHTPFRLGIADTTPGGDTIAPHQPESLKSTAYSTGVELSWDPVNTDQYDNPDIIVKEFRLYRTTAGTETDWKQNSDTIVISSGQTDYTDTDVVGHDTYYYRLTAVDTSTPENESIFSDTTSSYVPRKIAFNTAALRVGDGTDTLFHNDLSGTFTLNSDSDHRVKVEAYSADTVALYFNRSGTPAATSDTRVSLANVAADTWAGIIADTQTSAGDTINFILEAINTSGDTAREDNSGQGFEYRVHSTTEFNTATISVGDGADTLYYANLSGDSTLNSDSDHQVGVEAYSAETVALYFNRSGTPAATSDTQVYLANVAADSWTGIIADTQTSTGDTINFILEGINTAGDTTIEDSGGSGFEYRVNDVGNVRDYLRSILRQRKKQCGGSLIGGSTATVQQFHHALAQRSFKKDPVVVRNDFFDPGLGVSNRSGSEPIPTVEHVKIVG